jgi:hypothetical protein
MSRMRHPDFQTIKLPALSSPPVPAACGVPLPDTAPPVWPVAPPGGGPFFILHQLFDP